MMFARCPITWSSKLQTLVALSKMKAEYMALSMVLWEQTPLLWLLKEVIKHKVDTIFILQ